MMHDLKAVLVSHSTRKSVRDQGFTLIELLVVIVVIGILSAIALPSFLNQASKAKQSEAKQTIGAMNRAQQAYFLENYEFGTTVQTLGIGVHEQTVNYSYAILLDAGNTAVEVIAASLKRPLRHYQGRVWLDATNDPEVEAFTRASMVESRQIASVHTGLNGVVTSPNFGLIRDLSATQLQKNWRDVNGK